MKVKVLIGFVSTIEGIKYRVQAGDELELPKGADWVKAGLAEPVAPVKVVKRSKAKSKDG